MRQGNREDVILIAFWKTQFVSQWEPIFFPVDLSCYTFCTFFFLLTEKLSWGFMGACLILGIAYVTLWNLQQFSTNNLLVLVVKCPAKYLSVPTLTKKIKHVLPYADYFLITFNPGTGMSRRIVSALSCILWSSMLQ